MSSIDRKALLTKKDVQEILGVHPDTVAKWLRAGIPKTKQGKLLLFHRTEIAKWFAKSARTAKYVYALTPKKSADPADAPATREGYSSDLASTVERARQAELIAWEALQDVKATAPSMVAYWLEQHGSATEQRRKWEKDYAAIAFSLKDAIPTADVAAQWKALVEPAKDALLRLPNEAAPECEGKSAAEIAVVLRKKVVAALVGISGNG